MQIARYADAENVLRDVGDGFVAAEWPGERERVEMPDGTTLPPEWLYFDHSAGEEQPYYVVECAVGEDGVPRVITVAVCSRRNGREVRATDLRRIRPIESLLEDAIALAAFRRPADDPGALQYLSPDELAGLRRTVRGVRRADRRVFTDETAREVATVYVDNIDGGSPTKAVRAHFGIAESTASLYVKRARPLIDRMLKERKRGKR